MPSDVVSRHNVVRTGTGSQPMVFAHGFGCDQDMWRFVAPAFRMTHDVLLFDHAGCGKADPRAYDPVRHGSLDGYAEDVVAILEALDLRKVVFVGHSVSAMIGVLASIRVPERFDRLVLVGPSPRYLDDSPDYAGGFSRDDIDGLIDLMERNLVGWADYLAPVAMGADSPPEGVAELKASFCGSDPAILRRFARVVFLGDNRADLSRVTVPSLVLQVADDMMAPRSVGAFVHASLPRSALSVIEGRGHCPHMTHPEKTVAAIREYLAGPA